MRAFAIFLSLFLVATLVGGFLTYPVWSLLQGIWDVPIHRVMNRVGLLVLAIGCLLFLRQQGLFNKTALGYNLPRSQFLRQAGIGFAAGLLLMLPLAAVIYGLELRTLSEKFLHSDTPTIFVIGIVAKGLIGGCAIAFLEETFCRGALLAAIRRESGVTLAVVLSTLLYAATHFLGNETKLPTEHYTYVSGLQVSAKMFERFARPSEFVDSFLALAAFGALLVLIRLRTGAIAACIGLHAGTVTVITVFRKLTTLAPEASPWLVGSYDGVVGWLACAWISLVAFVYWRVRADRQKHLLIEGVPINDASFSR